MPLLGHAESYSHQQNIGLPPSPLHRSKPESLISGVSVLIRTGQFTSQAFETPQVYDGQNSRWYQSPRIDQSPHMNMDDQQQPYWKQTDSPDPSAYDTMQYNTTPSLPASSQGDFERFPHMAHAEYTWPSQHVGQPPMRSMSMINPSDLPPQYQLPYFSNSADDHKRQSGTPSDLIQPLPLGSNVSQMSYGNSHFPERQLSYQHQMTTDPASYGYQTSWSSVPPMQSPHLVSDYTQGWYHDSPGLAQVQEEDAQHSPHYRNDG